MNKKGILKHFDFFVIGVLCLIVSFFLSNIIRPFPNLNLGSDIYELLFIYELLSYIAISYFYNPYGDILKRGRFSLAYSTVAFGVLQLALVTFLLFIIKEGATISRLYLAIQYACFVVLSFICDLIWLKFLRKRISS